MGPNAQMTNGGTSETQVVQAQQPTMQTVTEQQQAASSETGFPNQPETSVEQGLTNQTGEDPGVAQQRNYHDDNDDYGL